MNVSIYKKIISDADLSFICREAENILKIDRKQELNWWFDLNKEPSNCIESYIISVIEELKIKNDYIGAEWWIRDRTRDTDFHALHVDSDVEKNQNGILVETSISTILYLTDCGGPTVILDEEINNKHSDKILYSYPERGKFLYFNTPYIHGVLPGYLNNQKRITLMFNLWKNRPEENLCKEYSIDYPIKDRKISIHSSRKEQIKQTKSNEFFVMPCDVIVSKYFNSNRIPLKYSSKILKGNVLVN